MWRKDPEDDYMESKYRTFPNKETGQVKVGHIIRVRDGWLSLYDGNVIGKSPDEKTARTVVENVAGFVKSAKTAA